MNFEISLYSLVLQNIQMRCELVGGGGTLPLVQYFNILVRQVEIVSINAENHYPLSSPN